MLLGFEQGNRFGMLFGGLLDYINKKHRIVPGLNFDFGFPEDMQSVAVVKDFLWENDELIDEYIKKNPHNLNIAQCDAVLKWKHHHTGMFFYIGEDEGYSVFADGNYFFHVSGHSKEIKNMLIPQGAGQSVETTLLPFEDKIVYDMTIGSYGIGMGPSISEQFHRLYESCKEKKEVIQTGESFIEKMKTPKESRPVLPMPGPDEEEEIPEWIEEEMNEMREEEMEWLVERLRKSVIELTIGSISNKKPKTTALEDILESRTKKQLMTMIKRLYVRGASTYPKARLIEIIKGRLYQKEDLSYFLLFCSEEEIKFIDKVVKQKTVDIALNRAIEISTAFHSSGLIIFVYGRKETFYATAADEFREIYKKIMTKEYRDYRETAYLISQYATAATGFYGSISMKDFIKDMKKYFGKTIDKEEILEILEAGNSQGIGTYTSIDEDIVHVEIAEDYDWYEYIKLRMQEFPRKEVPWSTMEKYYGEGIPPLTKEMQMIEEFLLENLKNSDYNQWAVELLMGELQVAFVQDWEIREILELLEDSHMIFDMDQTNALLQLIMDAKNNTALWGNNGWTPSELFVKNKKYRNKGQMSSHPSACGKVLPFIAPKKAGRNDPCPCGSGKKYKHCCLREEH